MDYSILLWINSHTSILMDDMMVQVSKTSSWMLMLIMLIVVLVRNRQGRSLVANIFAVILVIALADQVTSTIIKPMVCRLRPCNDPDIMFQLRLLAGHHGGFSFPSSHAANAFGVMTLVSLILRDKVSTILLLLWSLIVCYSRMYLAVHFPSDILVGAVIGAMLGGFVYVLLQMFIMTYGKRMGKYYSDAYTSSGFSIPDVCLFRLSIPLTVLYIIIASAIR